MQILEWTTMESGGKPLKTTGCVSASLLGFDLLYFNELEVAPISLEKRWSIRLSYKGILNLFDKSKIQNWLILLIDFHS